MFFGDDFILPMDKSTGKGGDVSMYVLIGVLGVLCMEIMS